MFCVIAQKIIWRIDIQKVPMTQWQIIYGIVKSGHKIASGEADNSPYPKGSIEMQTPFFKELGLDLGIYYPGTLNISIAPNSFVMKSPEFTFRNVNWAPGFPSEDFSFSRCYIDSGNTWHEGLVYYPHPETKIGHFHNASLLEIISSRIPGINYGNRVRVKLNIKEIKLEQSVA